MLIKWPCSREEAQRDYRKILLKLLLFLLICHEKLSKYLAEIKNCVARQTVRQRTPFSFPSLSLPLSLSSSCLAWPLAN